MAIPKVFVSSTCYDLAEERAQLERFISNYGFQPILSEYSGVYYDVDEHTHDACVNEVSHCDLFVLIISGRYGGKFKGGTGESITQAEYNRARQLKLPIFTFVKSDVLSAQHYYKENTREHGDTFAKKISYPAIHKQTDAPSIFSFIDSVHRSSSNNGYESYQSFSCIEKHLKKQWAGLFFSFLQKRKEQDKIKDMSHILKVLSDSSFKLESLVSSLHDKELGKSATDKLLNEVMIKSNTTNFFSSILRWMGDMCYDFSDDNFSQHKVVFTNDALSQLSLINTRNLSLIEYLSKIPLFCFTSLINNEHAISHNGSDNYILLSQERLNTLEYLYNHGVKQIDSDALLLILQEVYSDYVEVTF